MQPVRAVNRNKLSLQVVLKGTNMMAFHMEAGSNIVRNLKTELMRVLADWCLGVAIHNQILQLKVQTQHNFVVVNPMSILPRCSVLVMLHCHEGKHKL